MAMQPATAHQNGQGIWLYKRPLRHPHLRFLLFSVKDHFLTLSVCQAWGNPTLRAECLHCKCFSLASLRSQIAFFSKSGSAPRALPFFFLPGICEKKTAGRGFEQPVTIELTLAQCPRASPSPQRERAFACPLHST